jgi:hypothetical protein
LIKITYILGEVGDILVQIDDVRVAIIAVVDAGIIRQAIVREGVYF